MGVKGGEIEGRGEEGKEEEKERRFRDVSKKRGKDQSKYKPWMYTAKPFLSKRLNYRRMELIWLTN